MKIAVYLGSSAGSDNKYKEATIQVANWLVEQHHALVYGAGNNGLMGILATTVHEGGSYIIGVMPEFLMSRERLFAYIDEVYMVKTMSARKQKMIDEAEAFIALPGGPGTLEELSEIISLIRLHRIPGPCVIINLDGYYDALKAQLEKMSEEGFMGKDAIQNVHFISSPLELDSVFGS